MKNKNESHFDKLIKKVNKNIKFDVLTKEDNEKLRLKQYKRLFK